MSFAEEIKSSSARVISGALFSLLDEVTSPEIRELHRHFHMSDDKHAFLAQFEATPKNKKSSILLEQWMHYCWLRIELMQIAQQKASLTFAKLTGQPVEFTKGEDEKKEVKTSHTTISKQLNLQHAGALSGAMDSIKLAIEESVQQGVPIQQSIKTLRQVTLQIVGTEHPTDPLSEDARIGLNEIANELIAALPNRTEIRTRLEKLSRTSPIPFKKRTVEEEVQRNLTITLDKLFDSLPLLVKEIFTAYQQSYGKQLTLDYEEELWRALGGGLQSDGSKTLPIEYPSSWPGFDADGNDNVTPETMLHAIEFHHKHAEIKLSALLDKFIKEIEKIDGVSVAALLHSLKTYKESILNNKRTPETSELFITHFDNLLATHKDVLSRIPELSFNLKCFLIQLKSFGATFGKGHIRQDSSVYLKVWNTIFENIKVEPEFKDSTCLKVLQHRSYCEISDTERVELHKMLLGDSLESKQILKKIYENYTHIYRTDPRYSLVCRELDRYAIAAQNKEFFENTIISNCEFAGNIFEVESLKKIFSPNGEGPRVVPLLEKRQDLECFETIIEATIKFKIQKMLELAYANEEKAGKTQLKTLLNITHPDQIKSFVSQPRSTFKLFIQRNPALATYLRKIEQEVMFGFSDTERVSGVTALISIQKALEEFLQLAKDYCITPIVFHGPGGDANRGGLKRRDLKATLQGNAREMLNTTESALRFRETQFYQAYTSKSGLSKSGITAKSPSVYVGLMEYQKLGTQFYEFIHDEKKGLGKLLGYVLGQGAHWMVNLLNSSSRASQRGIPEKKGDRTSSVESGGVWPEPYIHPDKPRAITATQMKEMLQDYMGIVIGPGYALRKIGEMQGIKLYNSSETFRDIFHKLLFGMAMADLSKIEFALFGEVKPSTPENAMIQKTMADHCRKYFTTELVDVNPLTEEGRHKLKTMLPYFFAFIKEEYSQTLQFLFKLNKKIHFEAYRKTDSPKAIHNSLDLLYPYPEWRSQTEDLLRESEPLILILARQSYYISHKNPLDILYPDLSAIPYSYDELSPLGFLLGNIGAGITSFRRMPSGYYENSYLDYRSDLCQGVTRAERECKELTSPNYVKQMASMFVLPKRKEVYQVSTPRVDIEPPTTKRAGIT